MNSTHVYAALYKPSRQFKYMKGIDAGIDPFEPSIEFTTRGQADNPVSDALLLPTNDPMLVFFFNYNRAVDRELMKYYEGYVYTILILFPWNVRDQATAKTMTEIFRFKDFWNILSIKSNVNQKITFLKKIVSLLVKCWRVNFTCLLKAN